MLGLLGIMMIQGFFPQKLHSVFLLLGRNKMWTIHKRCIMSSSATRQWCGRLGGVGREVSSRIFLRVLGTALEDRAPSIYLFSDSQRYFFNCGENVIRLLHELNMNLDARKIFLTRLAWDNVAGLPLALRFLTGPSSRDKHVHVLGPQGTLKFIESIKTFSKTLTEMALVNSTEFHGSDNCYFTDDNVTIKPIILNGAELSNSYSQSHSSICYVCKLADLPGKLQKEKVEALGIPADQRISLTLGDSVILTDGTVVRPSDVISSPMPGQVIVIVDCPSLAIMDALISNHELKALTTTAGLHVDVVIHLTPKDVLNTNSYLSWVEQFGLQTQHIILSKDLCMERDPFQKSEELQIRLHSVNPTIFPLFKTSTVKLVKPILPKNCFVGKNMMTYHFRPLKIEGFEESEISINNKTNDYFHDNAARTSYFKLNFLALQSIENKFSSNVNTKQDRKAAIIEPNRYDNMATEIRNNSSISSSITGIQNEAFVKTTKIVDLDDNIGDSWCPENNPDDFTLTFLGTGASHPSSLRNNPGILLTTSDNNYLILDCGEGFYSQLELLYGKEKAEEIVAKCCCVFISHIHADHHMGVVKLLLLRKKLSLRCQLPELVIVGPKKLLTWLNKLIGCGIYGVDSSLYFKYLTFEGTDASFLHYSGIKRFEPVPVIHCHDSHGVVVEHEAGWKLVYSGDCRPSSQLVRAGKGATLLIHDATFRNEHSKNAARLSHSTIAEALDVSRRMQAKYTILTHFSRRYKIRSFANLTLPPNAFTAWDHMVVRLSDLPTLHKIRPRISRVLRKEFIHETKRKQFLQAEFERRQTPIRTETRERISSKKLD